MSRGAVWWGMGPLVVGAAGLLLLAVGAKGMDDPDEVNARARQLAGAVETELKQVADEEDVKDSEKRKEAAQILAQGEEALREEGKTVDLQSLAPKKGQSVDAEWAARVRDFIEQKLSDKRDSGAMIAQRIAFYGGLVLVFTAGVLLYRRTPDSVRGAW